MKTSFNYYLFILVRTVYVGVCPRVFYHMFRRPKRLVENDILMSTVYRRIIVAVFDDMVTRVVGTGCYGTYLISR